MDSSTKTNDRKHCKCKKTKCLKLYCICFAAGSHCDESCSCQDCFNRLDYNDTVVLTRQQIELRNPLAFAPKIHCLLQSTIRFNEDEIQVNPIAVQHRNGCNCKKSMCLKKYCACYQANVGCCDGCRCEGCQNRYGKKEYNEYKYNAVYETVVKETKSIGSEFFAPESNNPHNLTSWTPHQHSGHRNDTTIGTYIPSTEIANRDMMLDASRGVFGMIPLNQQSYPNVEFVNQFTPPMMDYPNSSRAYEDFCSLGSSTCPGSLVNPVSVFGGPKVNSFIEDPVYNIDEDTPTSLIYPSSYTGSVISRGNK